MLKGRDGTAIDLAHPNVLDVLVESASGSQASKQAKSNKMVAESKVCQWVSGCPEECTRYIQSSMCNLPFKHVISEDL